MNGSGETTIYSDYITSCQSVTEVEILPVEQPARKILVGGQLLIQIGEHIYTATGQRVQ